MTGALHQVFEYTAATKGTTKLATNTHYTCLHTYQHTLAAIYTHMHNALYGHVQIGIYINATIKYTFHSDSYTKKVTELEPDPA